ncbi:hypothetical protein [Ideonella sp. BN130291]|uniref:hypothetical protein n=1 Tax=Ideonella sp. BN130291 TaxID=3112940 RepID=UPI002E271C0E|nr:hypothetical protein [Ideonella sp. BN130291]
MASSHPPSAPLHPALAGALEEARALQARGWAVPGDATLAQAQRLLALVLAAGWRPPTVQADADGSLVLEWDAGARGWLQLRVDGSSQLTHSAVIEGDEYAKAEPFGDTLPDWADALLRRLLLAGH